jgi:hypothetical protein
MSESLTPETDSYWECWDRSGSNHDDRDKEFARRLERERDKLKAENAELVEALGNIPERFYWNARDVASMALTKAKEEA